jgi:hypothetical protein
MRSSGGPPSIRSGRMRWIIVPALVREWLKREQSQLPPVLHTASLSTETTEKSASRQEIKH